MYACACGCVCVFRIEISRTFHWIHHIISLNNFILIRFIWPHKYFELHKLRENKKKNRSQKQHCYLNTMSVCLIIYNSSLELEMLLFLDTYMYVERMKIEFEIRQFDKSHFFGQFWQLRATPHRTITTHKIQNHVHCKRERFFHTRNVI